MLYSVYNTGTRTNGRQQAYVNSGFSIILGESPDNGDKNYPNLVLRQVSKYVSEIVSMYRWLHVLPRQQSGLHVIRPYFPFLFTNKMQHYFVSFMCVQYITTQHIIN